MCQGRNRGTGKRSKANHYTIMKVLSVKRFSHYDLVVLGHHVSSTSHAIDLDVLSKFVCVYASYGTKIKFSLCFGK